VAIVASLNDEEALAAAAAERVTSLIEGSIAVRQAARVCLTGGHTPRRLYQLLADRSRAWRPRIDWTRVYLFWTDERCVPPDHGESNFGMAHRALLSHVPIPPAQVHRMRGELMDAAEAAREYEMILREARRHTPPDSLFDVMVLGLGEDAHIASLFPGSALLTGQEQRVSAVWVEHLNAWRLTLTPRALLDARAFVMLVSGSRKAAAVRAALDEPEDATRWPAHLLRAAGDRVEWFIDSAAARLRGAPPS
jgi:6-phosphogluconolactonase